MKKAIKYIILWYACFYILFFIIRPFEVNQELKLIILCYGSVILTILFVNSKKIINKFKEKYYKGKLERIKDISEKYKELIKLNAKYEFIELGELNREIYEREYSHKSYDRARAKSIIIYNIENNEDNIRDFILNAYRNKKRYDEYCKELDNINTKTKPEIIEASGFTAKEFDKLESMLIDKTKYNEDVYNISINVEVGYITRRYNNSKNRTIKYEELCDLYMEWRNGKKYKETAKRERKYMNDQLRYDVLKRDNFTCTKCGATAKDGVKLHVDHIIPVSKGGKTTMSNLQTLCERCNIGKGNKDN